MKTALIILIQLFAFGLWAEEAPLVVKDTYTQRINKLSQAEVSVKRTDQHYRKVDTLWREIANDLKTTISEPNLFVQKQASEAGIDEDPLRPWRVYITQLFDDLKKVSDIRAKSIRRHKEIKGYGFFFDADIFQTILLEFSLIPYRLRATFYEKYYWFNQNISSGWVGFVRIIGQLILLLLSLCIPVVFWKVARRLEKKIESMRQRAFYSSFRSPKYRRGALLLSVLSAYLPWFFAWAAITIISQTLRAGRFAELTVVLVYAFYYIYYKIFRITLELFLTEVASNISTGLNKSINSKIEETSKLLGRFLLVVFSLRAAFDSIMGQSLFMFLLEPLFRWLILFIIFFIAARWRQEVRHYLRDTGIGLLGHYARFMEDRWVSLLLSFPGLILVVVHFVVNRLFEFSSNYEFFRLIYARVLRVKLESSKASTGSLEELDQDYQRAFENSSDETFVKEPLEKNFLYEITEQIEDWKNEETTEQTVAIHGHQSTGKTTFLSFLEKDLRDKGLSVESLEVPARTISDKGLESLFAEILERAKSEKLVVLIDNVHNMFLSTIGGFDSYRNFLQMIEEQKNIFWVCSYNEFSWSFLNSILGKNQYFRLELSLPRWSSDQIKNLIQNIHGQTGYELVYDQIFRSSQNLKNGVNSTEQKFFYLLWERSGGNPGLAINYWLKSLRLSYAKTLRVCLPEENEVQELSKLHQEMHFIYAALFKHQNLNISEAARATNLPRALAKQALYRGVEEGFLDYDSGRYYVALSWFDDVKKYLKGKNLVYEAQR